MKANIRSILLVALVISQSYCLSSKWTVEELNEEINNEESMMDRLFFAKFKNIFEKDYSQGGKLPNESLKRQKIVNENYEIIKQFNKNEEKSYKLGVNQFMDMTLDELAEKYLDFNMSENLELKFLSEDKKMFTDRESSGNYSPIDWRDNKIFLPVRNQGDCGACWAFASVGTVEALRAKQFGIMKYLSPQQLVDCDTKEKGCKGGWPSIAYSYASTNGIVSEDNYGYRAQNGVCNSQVVSTMTETKIDRKISQCEEDECMTNDFQYNLLKNGPITIVIDAYNTRFFQYSSGIYDESCAEPNHAIMLVGYGVDSKTGTKYWIIRNSWGTSWGMNGYGYVKFDLNNYYSCNINRYGFQPKVLN